MIKVSIQCQGRKTGHNVKCSPFPHQIQQPDNTICDRNKRPSQPFATFMDSYLASSRLVNPLLSKHVKSGAAPICLVANLPDSSFKTRALSALKSRCDFIVSKDLSAPFSLTLVCLRSGDVIAAWPCG